jgi:hypothetical protein
MAAVLDFLVWGSGHGFLGYRKVLGVPWVLWSIILAVFIIIAAYIDQGLYEVTGLFTVSYDWGAAFAIAFIPYLIVGGLMVFDLMKKGAIPAIGKFGAPSGAQAMQTPQGAQAWQQPAPAARQAAAFCPSCGAAVTAADVFCPSCGAALRAAPATAAPAPAPVAPAGTQVCNNCGTANPAGFVYCKRCGNKLQVGSPA